MAGNISMRSCGPGSKDQVKEPLLDLYLPGLTNATPLVVWMHGGAWRKGSKEYPKDAMALPAKLHHV